MQGLTCITGVLAVSALLAGLMANPVVRQTQEAQEIIADTVNAYLLAEVPIFTSEEIEALDFFAPEALHHLNTQVLPYETYVTLTDNLYLTDVQIFTITNDLAAAFQQHHPELLVQNTKRSVRSFNSAKIFSLNNLAAVEGNVERRGTRQADLFGGNLDSESLGRLTPEDVQLVELFFPGLLHELLVELFPAEIYTSLTTEHGLTDSEIILLLDQIVAEDENDDTAAPFNFDLTRKKRKVALTALHKLSPATTGAIRNIRALVTRKKRELTNQGKASPVRRQIGLFGNSFESGTVPELSREEVELVEQYFPGTLHELLTLIIPEDTYAILTDHGLSDVDIMLRVNQIAINDGDPGDILNGLTRKKRNALLHSLKDGTPAMMESFKTVKAMAARRKRATGAHSSTISVRRLGNSVYATEEGNGKLRGKRQADLFGGNLDSDSLGRLTPEDVQLVELFFPGLLHELLVDLIPAEIYTSLTTEHGLTDSEIILILDQIVAEDENDETAAPFNFDLTRKKRKVALTALHKLSPATTGAIRNIRALVTRKKRELTNEGKASPVRRQIGPLGNSFDSGTDPELYREEVEQVEQHFLGMLHELLTLTIPEDTYTNLTDHGLSDVDILLRVNEIAINDGDPGDILNGLSRKKRNALLHSLKDGTPAMDESFKAVKAMAARRKRATGAYSSTRSVRQLGNSLDTGSFGSLTEEEVQTVDLYFPGIIHQILVDNLPPEIYTNLSDDLGLSDTQIVLFLDAILAGEGLPDNLDLSRKKRDTVTKSLNRMSPSTSIAVKNLKILAGIKKRDANSQLKRPLVRRQVEDVTPVGVDSVADLTPEDVYLVELFFPGLIHEILVELFPAEVYRSLSQDLGLSDAEIILILNEIATEENTTGEPDVEGILEESGVDYELLTRTKRRTLKHNLKKRSRKAKGGIKTVRELATGRKRQVSYNDLVSLYNPQELEDSYQTLHSNQASQLLDDYLAFTQDEQGNYLPNAQFWQNLADDLDVTPQQLSGPSTIYHVRGTRSDKGGSQMKKNGYAQKKRQVNVEQLPNLSNQEELEAYYNSLLGNNYPPEGPIPQVEAGPTHQQGQLGGPIQVEHLGISQDEQFVQDENGDFIPTQYFQKQTPDEARIRGRRDGFWSRAGNVLQSGFDRAGDAFSDFGSDVKNTFNRVKNSDFVESLEDDLSDAGRSISRTASRVGDRISDFLESAQDSLEDIFD